MFLHSVTLKCPLGCPLVLYRTSRQETGLLHLTSIIRCGFLWMFFFLWVIESELGQSSHNALWQRLLKPSEGSVREEWCHLWKCVDVRYVASGWWGLNGLQRGLDNYTSFEYHAFVFSSPPIYALLSTDHQSILPFFSVNSQTSYQSYTLTIEL